MPDLDPASRAFAKESRSRIKPAYASFGRKFLVISVKLKSNSGYELSD